MKNKHNIRKINSIFRQLGTKLSALENSIILHPSPQPPPPGSKEWEGFIQISPPTRKHLESLLEYVKDTIILLQYEPSEFPSLLQLCSFSMARLVIKLDPSEFDDFYTDFYDIVPEHLCGFVLFEHVVQVITRDASILQVLPQFADICAAVGAKSQVFEIMKRFWMEKAESTREEYRWAHEKLSKVNFSVNWLNFLTEQIQVTRNFSFEIPHLALALELCASTIKTQTSTMIPLALDFLLSHTCSKNHIPGSRSSASSQSACKCLCFDLLRAAQDLLHLVDQKRHFRPLLYVYISLLLDPLGAKDPAAMYPSKKEFSGYALLSLQELLPLNLKLLSFYPVDQLLAITRNPSASNQIKLGALIHVANTIRSRHVITNDADLYIVHDVEAEIQRVQMGLGKEIYRFEVIDDTWDYVAPPSPLSADSNSNANANVLANPLIGTETSGSIATPLLCKTPLRPAHLLIPPSSGVDPIIMSVSKLHSLIAKKQASRHEQMNARNVNLGTPLPLSSLLLSNTSVSLGIGGSPLVGKGRGIVKTKTKGRRETGEFEKRRRVSVFQSAGSSDPLLVGTGTDSDYGDGDGDEPRIAKYMGEYGMAETNGSQQGSESDDDLLGITKCKVALPLPFQ